MNNCSFVGRVGRDAVTRHTANGKAVTGWALAVDSGYGDNKQTVWLDCSAWGDRFEKVGEYILKGSRLAVHGELGTREHEGKTYVTLRVNDVTLIGDKAKPATAPAAPPKAAAKPADTFQDDDIPF